MYWSIRIKLHPMAMLMYKFLKTQVQYFISLTQYKKIITVRHSLVQNNVILWLCRGTTANKVNFMTTYLGAMQ